MLPEFEWQNIRLLTGKVWVQVPLGAPLSLGGIAQLVEQLTFNQHVTGSIPVALTILYM